MKDFLFALCFSASLGIATAQTPAIQTSAPSPPKRLNPNWPVRDPHTPGYVRATELPDGTIPPPNVDGNFILGPTHPPAPELNPPSRERELRGSLTVFTMSSADSKIYPGIGRNPGTHGKVDPNDPSKMIVTTSHPMAYMRTVTVYVPKEYVPGTVAPFIVGQDGPDKLLFAALDKLIGEGKLPPMIVVSIGNGADGHGDGHGTERGLEYDTVSGKYAEFVETEVLPRAETEAHVKLSKDPDARLAMGGSSGGAAAFSMAWFHPEWYHRVLTYSGTYVNQQWPYNPETPHGAWNYHETIIPNSPPNHCASGWKWPIRTCTTTRGWRTDITTGPLPTKTWRRCWRQRAITTSFSSHVTPGTLTRQSRSRRCRKRWSMCGRDTSQ